MVVGFSNMLVKGVVDSEVIKHVEVGFNDVGWEASKLEDEFGITWACLFCFAISETISVQIRIDVENMNVAK